MEEGGENMERKEEDGMEGQEMLRNKLLELTNQMKEKWIIKQISQRNSTNLV